MEAQDGPGLIIKKYGSTTFWGMFAAILVSKEIYILDAEFLLSCEVGLFALTGYVLTGDTLEKWSEEQDKEKSDRFNDASDFMLEMFNQYRTVQGTASSKPVVVEQYLKAYKSAMEEHAAFQSIKPAHAARVSVLQALEGIRAREEHAAAMEWQETVNTAVANVTKAFTSGDEALTAETLDLAINNLGIEPSADQVDPVKRLFMKEFE